MCSWTIYYRRGKFLAGHQEDREFRPSGRRLICRMKITPGYSHRNWPLEEGNLRRTFVYPQAERSTNPGRLIEGSESNTSDGKWLNSPYKRQVPKILAKAHSQSFIEFAHGHTVTNVPIDGNWCCRRRNACHLRRSRRVGGIAAVFSARNRTAAMRASTSQRGLSRNCPTGAWRFALTSTICAWLKHRTRVAHIAETSRSFRRPTTMKG